MDEAYSIKLPAFEGPMDLLLHLIRENKVDIYDIPIALITRQYLEFLGLMKDLDLEIAGEFVVMAATLIHIKSRMLLPVEETTDTIEEMDPRFELVQRLLEYQSFRDAALGFREQEGDWSRAMKRKPAGEGPEVQEPELHLFDLNIFDLIGAFKSVVQNAPSEIMTLTRETLTTKDRMNVILETLERVDALRFRELFEPGTSKAYLVVTFIALLELLRLGLARTYQEDDFGTVWVMRPAPEAREAPAAPAAA